MAYQIAVCDDEPLFCNTMEEYLLNYQKDYQKEFYVTVYCEGKGLLEDIRKGKFYHILLLDVEIGQENGTELAKAIREFSKQAVILFITIHDNFALQAYDVDALGYVVKPLQYERLTQLLDKALVTVDYLNERLHIEEYYLKIRLQSDVIRIPYLEILYMEKVVNRIDIHTKDRVYSTYESFRSLKSRMDNHRFPQVHQGYIVNFDAITRIDHSDLYLNEQTVLPVSRRYYAGLVKRHKEAAISAILEKRYPKNRL